MLNLSNRLNDKNSTEYDIQKTHTELFSQNCDGTKRKENKIKIKIVK